MNESTVIVQGREVTAFERLGYIDGAVRWSVTLEDGQVLILTSREFGTWIDASREPDWEPEPDLSRSAWVAIGLSLCTAVVSIGYGWLIRVGLI